MLTLARLGCKGTWQQQPTVCYRQHGRSITRNGLQQAECITRVMDEFFNQPTSPTYILDLENEVQYNISIWCVWVLFDTENVDQITTYLRRTRQYVDIPPAKMVQRWLGQLSLYCRASPACHHEKLKQLWPHFKAAIQVSESQWMQIERGLNLLMYAEKHKGNKHAD